MPPFYRPTNLGKRILTQYRFAQTLFPRGCGVFKNQFYVGDNKNRLWVFSEKFNLVRTVTIPEVGNNEVKSICSNGDYIFVALSGHNSGIWRSPDGEVFTKVYASTQRIYAGDCNNKGEFVFARAAPDGLAMIISSDNGNTVNAFNPVNAFSPSAFYNDVRYFDNGYWYFATNPGPGTFLRSQTAAGLVAASSRTIPAPFNQQITTFGYNNQILYAASTQSHIFYSTDNGSTWTRTLNYLATDGQILDMCPFDGALYCCDSFGTISRLNSPGDFEPLTMVTTQNTRYLRPFGNVIAGVGIDLGFIVKTLES